MPPRIPRHRDASAGVQDTHARLEAGLACVDAWLAGDNLHLIGEREGYFAKLREIAAAAHSKGPRIYDARVAALCLHHGISELWSADRDFSAFPQLKVLNPLVKNEAVRPRRTWRALAALHAALDHATGELAIGGKLGMDARRSARQWLQTPPATGDKDG